MNLSNVLFFSKSQSTLPCINIEMGHFWWIFCCPNYTLAVQKIIRKILGFEEGFFYVINQTLIYNGLRLPVVSLALTISSYIYMMEESYKIITLLNVLRGDSDCSLLNASLWLRDEKHTTIKALFICFWFKYA